MKKPVAGDSREGDAGEVVTEAERTVKELPDRRSERLAHGRGRRRLVQGGARLLEALGSVNRKGRGGVEGWRWKDFPFFSAVRKERTASDQSAATTLCCFYFCLFPSTHSYIYSRIASGLAWLISLYSFSFYPL